MSKSNHTEAQMIGALKQLEAGRKAEDVAREVGVSKHTIYAWKAKYGGTVPPPPYRTLVSLDCNCKASISRMISLQAAIRKGRTSVRYFLTSASNRARS